jgi:hypothetical protein
MTFSVRAVLSSTATWLLLGVAGCSTGSANPPQTEGTTGETSGASSGSAAPTSGTSGSIAPMSGSTTGMASGTSGTLTGSGATASGTSGTTSGATSGSTSGATSGTASGATSGTASGAMSGATTSDAGVAPTFADVYTNVIGCTCVPCHGPPAGATTGGFTNGKLDLSSSTAAYMNLVGVKATGSACGTKNLTRVVAGNAATSLLYNKVAGGTVPCGDPMPDGKPKLTADQVTLIKNWINGGASM